MVLGDCRPGAPDGADLPCAPLLGEKAGSDADTGKLTRRNDLIESLIESRSFPDFPAGDTFATH